MSKQKKPWLHDYRGLFAFTRPQLGLLCWAVLCMMISTIFDGVSMSMIVPFSDKILSNGKIVVPGKLPVFAENFIAKLNGMSQISLLYYMAGFLVVMFLFKGLFSYFQGMLMSDVGQRVMRDMRIMLYKKYQSLDLEYFTRKRSGELISRITNDVGNVENAVSYGFTDLVYQTLQIVLFSAIVLFIYWRLAIVAIMMVPFISIPIVLVGKKLRKISTSTQEKVADINSLLIETISGVRIVRAFGAENHEVDKYSRQNQDYYKLNMKSIRRTLALGPATEFIGVLGGVFILLYVGHQVIEGVLSFGVFGLFLGSVMMMIRPFKKLSGVNAIMQKAFAASTRIYEVLEIDPKIKDNPDAWEIKEIRDQVELRGVWFRYEDTDVLKDISVRCRKGQVVALVGASGAGKSTLVDLIPRFYDPQKGGVFVDNRDIRTLNVKSLRGLIGMVTQETILFNDSVKDNIAYGKQGASYDEIVDAAKKAFAHEFILNLPQGYDTYIGDRGVKLSGGERQRLAIARAVLKNPPILILDEATSQLDSESERLVQGALDVLMAGRTVFVIAHRLSTVKNATKIVVLQEGRIVEEGCHEELLERGGVYKRLHDIQFQA
ncbi:MAG: ABC transporter ATP-binding protein [Candidatus Omnitrophota bacterium]|nr:ABC transporter ATP-binding protein [Candidatus Omnitrophota bacterium]MDD5138153.1 ABC transporter ATP-binding protein [Candidatus Omnitrophota bacterium]MDD5538480.1 ABC transporter ATP-binding protein [Candidatus Omnitrophota bacterium]